MAFRRALVSGDGTIPQKMAAGDGFIANLGEPTNFNAQADATLTVTQVSKGAIFQGLTLTSDVTYTLPTAALLLATFADMEVGDSFVFFVTNAQSAAYDVIIAVGTGITKVGTNNALTVSPQSTRLFTLVKTSASAMDLY